MEEFFWELEQGNNFRCTGVLIPHIVTNLTNHTLREEAMWNALRALEKKKSSPDEADGAGE